MITNISIFKVFTQNLLQNYLNFKIFSFLVSSLCRHSFLLDVIVFIAQILIPNYYCQTNQGQNKRKINFRNKTENLQICKSVSTPI